MSLRPIDLQTLFMRQTELSREQAALHDSNVQKKAVEQSESAEETIERQAKVTRAEELPDGPSEVKTDPDAKQETKQRRPERGAEGEAESEGEPPAAEIVRDPSLGRNIDISG